MKYSPVANALKLIGGKWKIMILDSLLSKHMRFGAVSYTHLTLPTTPYV